MGDQFIKQTQPYSLYWHMYHTVHNIINLLIFHFNKNSTNTIKSGIPVQISSLCVSKKIMHFNPKLLLNYRHSHNTTCFASCNIWSNKQWTTGIVKKTIFVGHIHQEISLPKKKQKKLVCQFTSCGFSEFNLLL